MATSENGYSVQLRERDQGWVVAIVDERGEDVGQRTCRDRTEARLFASTIRQHIYWLSAGRFRAYYRLDVKDPTTVA